MQSSLDHISRLVDSVAQLVHQAQSLPLPPEARITSNEVATRPPATVAENSGCFLVVIFPYI